MKEWERNHVAVWRVLNDERGLHVVRIPAQDINNVLERKKKKKKKKTTTKKGKNRKKEEEAAEDAENASSCDDDDYAEVLASIVEEDSIVIISAPDTVTRESYRDLQWAVGSGSVARESGDMIREWVREVTEKRAEVSMVRAYVLSFPFTDDVVRPVFSEETEETEQARLALAGFRDAL